MLRSPTSLAAGASGGRPGTPRRRGGHLRRAVPALCIALAAQPALAQQPRALALRDAGPSVVVESTLSAPVAVMAAEERTGGGHAWALVPARGSATMRKRGAGVYGILRMEPISWTVPLRSAPGCQADAGSRAELLAALRRDMDQLSATTQDEVERGSALATQIAQLEVDADRDRRNTERYNALSMEIRRQYFRDNPTGDAYVEQDRQDATEDFIYSMVELNTVFAAGDDAKRSTLSSEADHLRVLAEQGDSALAMVRAEYERAREQAQAGLAFQRLVTDQLEARPAGFATDVRVSGAVRRVCPGAAAGVTDQVEITAVPTDPRTAVIVGEARFDGGVVQRTAFRRVAGSDRWVATVFWPVDAAAVQLRVRADGSGWRRVDGRLQPGRPTLEAGRRETERAIAQVRRRHAEVRFRSEGADGVKTVIIP